MSKKDSAKTANRDLADSSAGTAEAEDETGPVNPIHSVTEQKHAPVDEASGPASEDEVMMLFPRPVNIIHKGIMHRFGKGKSKVPNSLADHWYLRDNGVELVK